MEYFYFVIIVLLVLKILFWTFYFYVRAQRLRQTQTTQRFIIVGARPVTRVRRHPYNDRSAIIDHAEPVSATGPPPYAEVVKDGSYPLPPSYDQATAIPANTANIAMPTTSDPGDFQSGAGGASFVGARVVAPQCQGSTSQPSAGNAGMSGFGPAAGQVNGHPAAGFSHMQGGMDQNFPSASQQ